LRMTSFSAPESTKTFTLRLQSTIEVLKARILRTKKGEGRKMLTFWSSADVGPNAH
jgi:hypothetical protein